MSGPLYRHNKGGQRQGKNSKWYSCCPEEKKKCSWATLSRFPLDRTPHLWSSRSRSPAAVSTFQRLLVPKAWAFTWVISPGLKFVCGHQKLWVHVPGSYFHPCHVWQRNPTNSRWRSHFTVSRGEKKKVKSAVNTASRHCTVITYVRLWNSLFLWRTVMGTQLPSGRVNYGPFSNVMLRDVMLWDIGKKVTWEIIRFPIHPCLSGT